jgi:hypothetical protein
MGSSRRVTAFSAVNAVTLTPMPSAIVSIAIVEKPGRRPS